MLGVAQYLNILTSAGALIVNQAEFRGFSGHIFTWVAEVGGKALVRIDFGCRY